MKTVTILTSSVTKVMGARFYRNFYCQMDYWNEFFSKSNHVAASSAGWGRLKKRNRLAEAKHECLSNTE